MPLQTIFNQIKNDTKKNGIDLRPPYQRGFIWGPEFIDKLMVSIVKQWPIGNISLRVLEEPNKKGAMQEVVDGQQRLTSIRDFMNGHHSVQGESARQIILYICDYMDDDDKKLTHLKKKLGNKGKISLKFSQLPDAIQETFCSYPISISSITNASNEEIIEYFKFLQNQERLRAGELIHSLPTTVLEEYLDKIKDKDEFLRILGFGNDRRQFDRAFYSVLGLLEDILNLGAMDKDVINYVANAKVLGDSIDKKCIAILNQINKIAEMGLPVNLVKANVRYMKFFLLTAAIGYVDYTTNNGSCLVTLDSLNRKLSAFASSKAKEVERVFSGYSRDVIEEHRLLALVSKGGNNLERATNRAQILAYYVNDFDNKTVPSGIIPI